MAKAEYWNELIFYYGFDYLPEVPSEFLSSELLSYIPVVFHRIWGRGRIDMMTKDKDISRIYGLGGGTPAILKPTQTPRLLAEIDLPSSSSLVQLNFDIDNYYQTNNGFSIALDSYIGTSTSSFDFFSSTSYTTSDFGWLFNPTTSTVYLRNSATSSVGSVTMPLSVPLSSIADSSVTSLVLVITYQDPNNSNNSSAKLYVNKNLVTTFNFAFVATASDKGIGWRYSSFSGTIPYVFDRPLTQSQIEGLYSSNNTLLPLYEYDLTNFAMTNVLIFSGSQTDTSLGYFNEFPRSSAVTTVSLSPISSILKPGSSALSAATTSNHPLIKKAITFDGSERISWDSSRNLPSSGVIGVILERDDSTRKEVVFQYYNQNTSFIVMWFNGDTLFLAKSYSSFSNISVQELTLPSTTGVLEIIFFRSSTNNVIYVNGVRYVESRTTRGFPEFGLGDQTGNDFTIGGSRLINPPVYNNFKGLIYGLYWQPDANASAHPLILLSRTDFTSTMSGLDHTLSLGFHISLRNLDVDNPNVGEEATLPAMPSPIFRYTLDGTLADSAGNLPDLNPTNGTPTPTYVPFVLGGSGLLIESSAYEISVASFAAFASNNNASTISFWFKPPATTPSPLYTSNRGGLVNGYGGYTLSYYEDSSGNQLLGGTCANNFSKFSTNPVSSTLENTITKLSTRDWIHVVWSFRSGHRAARVYVNGVYDCQSTPQRLGGTLTIPNGFSFGNVRIFGSGSTTINIAKGVALADIRFYDVALTKNQIRSLYNLPPIEFKDKPLTLT